MNKVQQKNHSMTRGNKRKGGPLKNGDNGDVTDAIGATRTTTLRRLVKIYPGMSWRLRTPKSYPMKFLAGCFFDEPT